ncbi:MAG: hypothetical protein FWE24_03560 [Defluviitaleaceae bacterium]|nr:hypothetical protein [Defluviitaleaceae bacterium]
MKSSKKEERLIILNTLRDGKITVDESIKLLNAIDGCHEGFEFGGSNVNVEEKFEKFTSSLDSFAKEVGEKAKTTYKDLEPKLKSGTKTVIEKTMSVLGDINKSLEESLENMKKAEEEEEKCNENCVENCEEHKED